MRTQIIEKKKYRGKVEKIKTIGSTYMAATGLGENQVCSEHTYIHTYINIRTPVTSTSSHRRRRRR